MSATVDIWLERMHTRPQVSVVKCLAFSPLFDEDLQSILSMPWESVAVYIANLAMEPKALFVFSSTESATLFGEHIITVPKMASLRDSNRLIYVLEDEDKQSLSVIKEGEDGEWITLGKGSYHVLVTSSLIPDRLAL